MRPIALDDESYADPLSLNGRIGHFGVGAQNSAFFMAREELVVTKHQHEGRVRELLISEDDLHDKYRDNPEKAYSKEAVLRDPCDGRSALLTRSPGDPHPVLRELLEKERSLPSFTLLVLSGIKEPHKKQLEGARQMTLTEMLFFKQASALARTDHRHE